MKFKFKVGDLVTSAEDDEDILGFIEDVDEDPDEPMYGVIWLYDGHLMQDRNWLNDHHLTLVSAVNHMPIT